LASVYESFLHGKKRVAPEQIPQLLVDRSEKDFDPQTLAVFLSAIGLYPPGTYVELTTGLIGLVLEPNRSDIFRPIVRIEKDENGAKPARETRRDLVERDADTGAFLLSVRRSVASAAL
jgi:hypothetical protein